AANFPAIATRHHHVEQHERRPHRFEQSQRFIAIVRDGYRISANLEVLTNDLGIVVIIVDHQDWRQVGIMHVSLNSEGFTTRDRAGIPKRARYKPFSDVSRWRKILRRRKLCPTVFPIPP